MLSSAAGNDLLFNENLCNQGKNFANKIWNAFRLIDSWKLDVELKQSPASKDALEIFNNKFNKTIEIIDRYFKNYRISEALMTTYKLTWDDFCSWLLETLKPSYGSGIDKKSYDKLSQDKGFVKNIVEVIDFFKTQIKVSASAGDMFLYSNNLYTEA